MRINVLIVEASVNVVVPSNDGYSKYRSIFENIFISPGQRIVVKPTMRS